MQNIAALYISNSSSHCPSHMQPKATRKLAYLAERKKIPCNCLKNGAVVLYPLSSHLAKFLKSFSLNAQDSGCKNSTSLHVHYRANGKYDEMEDKTKEYQNSTAFSLQLKNTSATSKTKSRMGRKDRTNIFNISSQPNVNNLCCVCFFMINIYLFTALQFASQSCFQRLHGQEKPSQTSEFTFKRLSAENVLSLLETAHYCYLLLQRNEILI